MKYQPNSIDELCRLASERFTGLDIEVDPPSNASGSWFVDLKRDEQLVTIQWQEAKGFGLSCRQESGYGEGPDELYPNVESCFARIVSLLLSRSHTRHRCVDLSGLRRERGMSQVDLADAMNCRQAAISKLEHRCDMRVSSLRKSVAGLGGTLEITARFPDGKVRVIDVSKSEESK